ncbi:MAG: ATP-binding response regulator [Acidiferrobacterales bacterium]
MGTPIVRILLIEDDQVDRLACRRALDRQAGRIFDIQEADLARQGLAYALTRRPDLILLDYRLPDLNGVEVLTELRGVADAPPVIMLTGASDLAIAVEAMRCGARDYLIKDTAGEYLVLLPAVIERVLREQHMRTGKRRMEEDLRMERDFISAVLATVGAAVVVLDREGRIVRLNEACEEISGYRFEEVRGRFVWDMMLPPSETDAVKQVFSNLRSGLFPNRFENSWQRKDGSHRLIAWSNTALTDSSGEVEYVIATGLDITDRRSAEEQALRYRVEIERIYHQYALGAFASVFAHELNQPLTAIVGYSDASLRLIRSGQNDEQLVHNIQQTGLQAHRAAHIIRDIRHFLRRDPPETSVEELNGLVGKVISQVAPEADAAGVRLIVDLGEVPQVRVGHIAVEKVLLNLLQNALEAVNDSSMQGGTVTVRTQEYEAGFVRITVTDTGPGLDPEDGKRLFQPFFTTKAEGLGMGLAISRTIVEAHGGRLWLESGEGGATFHFTVPMEP